MKFFLDTADIKLSDLGIEQFLKDWATVPKK